MSLLLETIKLQDGEFQNLFYHEARMHRSLKMLCGENKPVDLEDILSNIERPKEGLHKCRIVYDENSREIEFIPYSPATIQTLRIVEHDRISYEFKYADRKQLNRLYELRGDADDILIVKNGMATDSSYANIVFRRGKQWFTPWSALLKGTMRAYLLELNQIQEEEITRKDIRSFESFRLINAMLGFESPERDIANILF